MASILTGRRRTLTFRCRCRHEQQDTSTQHTSDGADGLTGSQPGATRSSTTSTSTSTVEPSGPGHASGKSHALSRANNGRAVWNAVQSLI